MLCTTLSNLQSNPSLSVFIMAACRTDFCRLGPQDTVSIVFFNNWVAMEIHETNPRPSCPVGSFPVLNRLLRSYGNLGAFFPGFTAAQGVRADAAILNS